MSQNTTNNKTERMQVTVKNVALGLENKALRLLTIVGGTILISLPFINPENDN